MNIRGMIKFSLIDYPDRIACVIFVGGCNFRCPFCHNPHLVIDPESQPQMDEDVFIDFLKSRVRKIDALVISGGEPALRPNLSTFLKKVKDLGFMVKIDTNGSQPDIIISNHSEGLIDMLSIDYKAPAAMYPRLTGRADPEIPGNVARTIRYAVEKGISLDVRTTVHRNLLSSEDLGVMRDELNSMGVSRWTLQQFNPAESLQEDLKEIPTFSDEELCDIARSLGNHTRVRGLVKNYSFD